MLAQLAAPDVVEALRLLAHLIAKAAAEGEVDDDE
jgi:hypothetical protein